jgi:PPK2 family polyphosphate:nucleotide phosphotransferase
MDAHLRFVTDLATSLKVPEGRDIKLSRDFDPCYTDPSVSHQDADGLLAQGIEALAGYQERLVAQDSTAVLLVLQALDAGGKDGTIKHVMTGLNPQGVEVHSFKQPSSDELQHDFLWRHQRALPGRGRIGIFNRSHYEEVLALRVHPELLAAEHTATGDDDIWKRRYREINDWEHHLNDSGTRVVKVLLNLSKDEQARRFLSRIDENDKHWKFSPSDVRERHHWDAYQVAFSQMLTHTSTPWAPWYVVPADHKWFTRLGTAAVLLHALADIDPAYPAADPAVVSEMASARAELLADLGKPSTASPEEA